MHSRLCSCLSQSFILCIPLGRKYLFYSFHWTEYSNQRQCCFIQKTDREKVLRLRTHSLLHVEVAGVTGGSPSMRVRPTASESRFTCRSDGSSSPAYSKSSLTLKSLCYQRVYFSTLRTLADALNVTLRMFCCLMSKVICNTTQFPTNETICGTQGFETGDFAAITP